MTTVTHHYLYSTVPVLCFMRNHTRISWTGEMEVSCICVLVRIELLVVQLDRKPRRNKRLLELTRPAFFQWQTYRASETHIPIDECFFKRSNILGAIGTRFFFVQLIQTICFVAHHCLLSQTIEKINGERGESEVMIDDSNRTHRVVCTKTQCFPCPSCR